MTTLTKAEREYIRLHFAPPLDDPDPDIIDVSQHVIFPARHRQCGSPTPSQGCQGACSRGYVPTWPLDPKPKG